MLDNKIEKIIDTVTIMNNSSSDITSRILNIKNKKIGYIFLDSTASDDKIGNIILENIKNIQVPKVSDDSQGPDLAIRNC